MPDFTIPFAQPPSALPPGSSHFVSNALIIAKRAALGLEDPVRIRDGKWAEGSPLFDWYQRHRKSTIVCMQLRKERKSPFFHEYVAFRFNGGTYFRVDRRQLPDEQSPMACTEDRGVEAYDTIEQIASLDDSMYNRSDCLVQLDFIEGVRLVYFSWIFRAISKHERARIYTVQRFNCYFYSQTLILCTLCYRYGWCERDLWRTDKSHLVFEESSRTRLLLARLKNKPGISIKIMDKQSSVKHHPGQASHRANSGAESIVPTGLTAWGVSLRVIQDNKSNMMRESTIGDLQEYLSKMIYAHGARVEQYKFLLRCNAEDVERDFKATMDQIWRKSLLWLPQ